jgi:hypothetical protein
LTFTGLFAVSLPLRSGASACFPGSYAATAAADGFFPFEFIIESILVASKF